MQYQFEKKAAYLFKISTQNLTDVLSKELLDFFLLFSVKDYNIMRMTYFSAYINVYQNKKWF